jgi:hypothetical protein
VSSAGIPAVPRIGGAFAADEFHLGAPAVIACRELPDSSRDTAAATPAAAVAEAGRLRSYKPCTNAHRHCLWAVFVDV